MLRANAFPTICSYTFHGKLYKLDILQSSFINYILGEGSFGDKSIDKQAKVTHICKNYTLLFNFGIFCNTN